MKSKKLNKAFDEFVSEMKKRLTEKEDDGWTGWDCPEFYGIRERLFCKLANPTRKNYVDIANFCMMLRKQIKETK